MGITIESGDYKQLMEGIKTGGLGECDLLRIGNKVYMLLGLGKQGGPGKGIIPEPVFTTPVPTTPRKMFYIRDEKDPFWEGNLPDCFKEGQSVTPLGSEYPYQIEFIGSSDWERVGHLTREQWFAERGKEFCEQE